MATLAIKTLENVTFFWPFLSKKNEMANKYTLDVCNLNKDHIKILQDMQLGPRIRTKNDDRGTFITCKSAKPPIVVDGTGENMDGVAIGNGSKGRVTIQAYTGTYPGVFAGLGKVEVTNLVVFGDDTVEDVMKDFDIAS